MAKKASRSPSKGTKSTDTTTDPPKASEAVQDRSARSAANVTFAAGDAVEISLPSEVAESCFALATGIKCPQSVVSISLTPPREGRTSVLSLRFVTPAAAGEFVAASKLQG